MKKETGRIRGRVIVGAIAALVIGLLFMWKPADRAVPDALMGDWRTSDARYADRELQISPVTISFTTGEGTVETGTIQKINKAVEGARTLYTVEYDMDRTRNEVSFYLDAEQSKNVIRFKNQPNIVWTKDENS